MRKNDLNLIYKQNLEADLVSYLAEITGRTLRETMDIYYKSRLASQIAEGLYGIENMDYKYLANDLIENEPELLQSKLNDLS